jgi:hypothetical protein
MGRLVPIPREVQVTDLSLQALSDPLMHSGYSGLPQPQPQTVIAADNYLERVAKYVPAEVLAFSLFVNSILDQAIKNSGSAAMMAGFPVTQIAIGALLIGLLLTPVFFWYVHEEGDAWVTNAFVSTLAFPFWSYAMGAVAFAPYRDGNLAAILLATFTVCSGLVAPRIPSPKSSAQKKQTSSKDGPRLVEPGVA